MKYLKIVLFLFSLTFFMQSCASGYKTITPDELSYSSQTENSGVLLEYRYNVLSKRKYSKKEVKTNTKLLAVRVTNNTNKPLVFGSDIKLTNSKGVDYTILPKETVYNNLKQKTASYLWYLLLTPLQFQKTENGSTSSTPIGLVVGPVVAGGNMLVSTSANTKFKNNLNVNYINEKSILPGESISGLIGILSSDYDSIILEVKR